MTDNLHPSQTPLQMKDDNTLLEVNNLQMYFPITQGLFGQVKGYTKAADDVSFFIHQGETVGLVGESGCGKTTVGRCVVRAYTPTGGEILYRREDGSVIDLGSIPTERFGSYRGSLAERATQFLFDAFSSPPIQPYRKDIRLIFQDPYSSLNPRMTVFDNISEVLKVNKLASQAEMKEMVQKLLQRVGLRPEYMQRYPHAFSGGERQRIGIARALITNPRLVVCDEAVSALDVSIRAQILNLLEELQDDFNLTYLFISHDLSVIRHICDRVVVMYVGKVVEVANGLRVYTNPLHPYTEALMSAVPIPDPSVRKNGDRIRLEGEIADPSNPPTGCYFHPRCRYTQERCQSETPVLRDLSNDHHVACHFAEELSLKGVRMVS